MHGKRIHFIVLSLALPVLLSFIVYRGFTSNYRVGIRSADEFAMRYDHGVYRYRVLGTFLVRALDRRVGESSLGRRFATYLVPEAARSELGIDAPPTLYASLFLLNTLFLCLTTGVLYAILRLDVVALGSAGGDLLLFAFVLLIAISQYVIVPYDTLSYFFLAAAMFIVLSREESNGDARDAALVLVVALATLTRETAALIVAFLAAVQFRRGKLWAARTLARLLALAAAFLGTYVGLRLVLGADETTRSFRLLANLASPSSLAGLGLLLLLVYLILKRALDPQLCYAFLTCASPYLVAVVLVADPWEMRLWVPLLVPLGVLGVIKSPHPR